MRSSLSNRWKYAALGVGAGLFAYAAALAFGQFWVIRAAQPFTYAGIDEVPVREVALVPGVGCSHPGRPPRNLLERLRVALALYRAHKVGAILISGVADGSPGTRWSRCGVGWDFAAFPRSTSSAIRVAIGRSIPCGGR